MKLFIVIFILINTRSIYSQWQPDVRLTNDLSASYTGYSNAKCIAASGDTIHIVWEDYRDGYGEIYYKRSFDGGLTWQSDSRLTNNASDSWYPSISVVGSYVHVVWQDYRDGNYEIYYKSSIDGGTNFGDDTKISNDPLNSGHPSIYAVDSLVHVAWGDDRHDGVREIYYKRSTDSGNTWGDEIRITNDPADSRKVCITGSDSFVHLIWMDSREDSNYEIYYKRSENNGLSWGADTRLTITENGSEFPSIVSSGSVLHVVWTDGPEIARNIFYIQSLDHGLNWQPFQQLTTDTTSNLIAPSMASFNSTIHIVWEDKSEGNNEIYYKSSLNDGSIWEPDIRLSDDAASSENPFIVTSGTSIHVIWQDDRDGNYEIYYKLNPMGVPTGILNVNPEILNDLYLYQNYPNPFNTITKIRFNIPYAETVALQINLSVYNIFGLEVKNIVNEKLNIGNYEVDFNGEKLPAGLYYIVMHAIPENAKSEAIKMVTKQMVLIK